MMRDRERGITSLWRQPLRWLRGVSVMGAIAYAMVIGCGKAKESEGNPPPQPVAQDTSSKGGPDLAVLGDSVYAQHCVLCHGPNGKGDGPGAAAMNPKPRDHTDGAYMNSRTDAQLLDVIRNGKGGMPAWSAMLSAREIQAALVHVRSLARPQKS